MKRLKNWYNEKNRLRELEEYVTDQEVWDLGRGK